MMCGPLVTLEERVEEWRLDRIGGRTISVRVGIRTFTETGGRVGGVVVRPMAVVLEEAGRRSLIPIPAGEDGSELGDFVEALVAPSL